MKPVYRRMVRRMKAKEKQSVANVTAGAIWFLYILKCSDGSFYTGVTTDIDRRFREHQEGKASRYTRTRRPVVLIYQEKCGTRSRSLARECAIKSLNRRRKEELIIKRVPPLRG